MVEPEFIEPVTAVTVEKLDAGRACASHLGRSAVDERAKIVDEDDRRLVVVHRTMMPGLLQHLDPGTARTSRRCFPIGRPEQRYAYWSAAERPLLLAQASDGSARVWSC
jgi:hypothetical protein